MPETEAVARLKRQLQDRTKHLNALRKLLQSNAGRMSARLHKHIVIALHPDRAPASQQRQWTAYAQEFGGLEFILFDDDGNPIEKKRR